MRTALLPIVAAQGLWVRRKTPRLPPAQGPCTGRAGPASPHPLRVAVLGESTAAGVGVPSHEEGFPGHLARFLSTRTGRDVTWRVTGEDGATIRRVRRRLLGQVDADVDLVVLLIGVNDVLRGTSPVDWAMDLSIVLRTLADSSRSVVVPGIAPFDRFPSLPAVLANYLAERARVLDTSAREVCREIGGAAWIPPADGLEFGADFFAADGFHPSSVGYRRWAQVVVDHLPALP